MFPLVSNINASEHTYFLQLYKIFSISAIEKYDTLQLDTSK